jgi:formylglycine-generating enzyme required for sulfatase activity
VAGAAPQFEFVGWNGAVPANSTLPQLSLVMDTPRMIGADFKPQLTAAGTPHWWLDTHARVSGGDYEAAEAGDADGDGQSAREEFLAGMSDRDPKRRFQVSQLARDGARGEVLLTWTACAGRNYSVSRSHDLALPFMPLGSPVAGVSPAMSAVFPAAERRNFYRVETTLAPGGPLDPDPPALSPQSQPGVIGRAMRRVPTGWFTRGTDLGDANAKPAHAVWVAGFEIDRFEVTRADWEAVAAWAAAHDYDIPLTPGFVTPPDHPATGISWYQAVKWCNARSEMDGRVPAYYTDTGGFTVFRRGEPDLTAAHVNWAGNGYRLPTEAEWERASRGGMEGFPYPWGDAPAETRANHWDYSLQTGRAPTGVRPYTLPAGSFATAQQPNSDDANAYDLHDMVGNVREWTWDRMASYGPDPQLAPRGPDAGSDRVLRGGSWLESMTHTTNVQRNPIPPDRADIAGTNGFRCVRGLHPNE